MLPSCPVGSDRTILLGREDRHLDENQLAALVSGSLDPDEHRAVLGHLDACSRCRQVAALAGGVDVTRRLERPDAPAVTEPAPGGNDATVRKDPLVGAQLGEYRVLESMARGGMGAVYRGVQPVIGKPVAVKVLLPEAAADPNLVHRLLTEARAVASIGHPNIIDVFSFGQTPTGQHYFVMEYLEGEPLSSFARARGRLRPDEVLGILDQVLAGLDAAHAKGVLHRDLKPGNIFVTPLKDGTLRVKLLDFGLAKTLGGASKTSPSLVLGTPGFMAPEQIRGEPVTERADLYAVGVIAFVLLAGREPFAADSHVELLNLHLTAVPPRVGTFAPGTPADLQDLVERLLQKPPSARPGSAAEVRREVQRMLRAASGPRTLHHERAVLVPLPEPLRRTAPADAASTETGGTTDRHLPEAPPAVVETARLQPEAPSTRPPAPSTPLRFRRPTLARLALGVGAAFAAGVALVLVLPGQGASRPDDAQPPGDARPVDTPSVPRGLPGPGPAQPADVAADPPVDAVPQPPPGRPGADPAPTMPAAPPAADPRPPRPAPAPRPLRQADVEARLASARAKFEALGDEQQRRLALAELARLEARLQKGEAPKVIDVQLKELQLDYAPR